MKVNSAGSERRNSGNHRLRVKLLLLLGSAAFTLILGEIVMRFFCTKFGADAPIFVHDHHGRYAKQLVADPATGWRLRPSLPGFSNAEGFRGTADFDPSDKRKKIILVGDSITFGSGVPYEDTFGAILESQLGGSAVVWNMSMPGFAIDQMWQSVRTQALPLKPNLVIVGFVVSDLARSLVDYRPSEGFYKPTFKLVGDRLVPRAAQDRPGLLVRSLQAHSCLWRLGTLALRWLALRVPVSEWWVLNEAILDAIRVDCRADRVPVVFVYLPTRERRHFPTLRSYMKRVGANFIDLTEEDFSALPDVYRPVDGHLTPKGHRYVADALLRWIQNNMPELSEAIRQADSRPQ